MQPMHWMEVRSSIAEGFPLRWQWSYYWPSQRGNNSRTFSLLLSLSWTFSTESGSESLWFLWRGVKQTRRNIAKGCWARQHSVENSHSSPAHKRYEYPLGPNETESPSVKGNLSIIHEESTWDMFVCVITHMPGKMYQLEMTTDESQVMHWFYTNREVFYFYFLLLFFLCSL